ncbi:MAG: triose-phosphate isomerase [Bacteroidota bacterium]|nr:triose-phosphate isomerase [Bacteroidota bacterium]
MVKFIKDKRAVVLILASQIINVSQLKPKTIVAANWKMNLLPTEGIRLLHEWKTQIQSEMVELIIAAPFTHLSGIQFIRDHNVNLAGQNCNEHDSGAYTGEISAAMLVDLNCRYVIIGHSERRQMDPTEDQRIALKISMAAESGLKVIYCCGEPLKIRENHGHFEFVSNQLKKDLFHLPNLDSIIIAYEPIWAIGTGITASPEEAQDVHAFIRVVLTPQFGLYSVNNLSILYGGSVKASNALNFARQKDINGALVGGASLITDEFKGIVQAFEEQ